MSSFNGALPPSAICKFTVLLSPTPAPAPEQIPTLTTGGWKGKLPCLVQGPPDMILPPTSLLQAMGLPWFAYDVTVKVEIHALSPNMPSARCGGIRDTSAGSPKPQPATQAPQRTATLSWTCPPFVPQTLDAQIGPSEPAGVKGRFSTIRKCK